MAFLWLIIYNIFVIPALWGAFRIAGFFNEKIQRGLDGRKHLLGRLSAKLSNRGGANTVWLHVASLGEFEQAKPIIEALKEKFPSVYIFVSFFSPSGFDYALDYKPADAVAYLPFDSYFAAQKFVRTVRPAVAVFIRYELWLNHLQALHSRNIPTLLACASAQNFEKKNFIVRSFNRNAFKNFTEILCVTESDAAIYKKNLDGAVPCIVAGDTKYDRVAQRASEAKNHPPLAGEITAGKFVLVAGSTWSEDEDFLLPAIETLAKEHGKRFLCVLAPHEPTLRRLAPLEGAIPCCRLSRIDRYENENTILVDSVGYLFSLYQYADVVFIGGGFKQGVHNVLEPAVFGAPVLCGPQIGNAREAQELMNAAGGHIVHSTEEIVARCTSALLDPASAAAEGARAKNFVELHGGATEKIVAALAELNLL